jgi:hypothetical protein
MALAAVDRFVEQLFEIMKRFTTRSIFRISTELA